jgi:site-specific DNA-methyltransferase (adenine-specific)
MFKYDEIYQPTLYLDDAISKLDAFEDDYFDLVVADPPYFKVVGEKWDYQWRTETEYLDWCEEWVEKLYKKTRYGGSFYLFGYFRTLSKLVERVEKYGFVLRQHIVIDKGIKSVAGRKTSTYRMFPNVTESILFFYKDNRQFIKPLFKGQANKLGYSAKDINEKLGVKSNGGGMWSIYTGNNICQQFPTEKFWNKITKILEIDIPYAKVSLNFNILNGVTDVWSDIEFYFKDRVHPTQKPYRLIERIILSSSIKNDNVLDPFAGSGVTGVVCRDLERKSHLIESDDEYFNIIKSQL